MTDILLFNLLRRKKREWSKDSAATLSQSEVDETNAVIRDWKKGAVEAAVASAGVEGSQVPAEPATGAGEACGEAQGPTKGLPFPSPDAFAIIKEFEGYAKALPDGRVEAYPDPASGGEPWTVGFGSTGPGIRRGTIWTREQAEARLEEDVRRFALGVARAIDGAPTAQHEFDAAVALAYNIGLANFLSSTLLRKHKAGDKAGAAEQFIRWDKASGRRMAGLTRRREAEAKLYRGER